jgi:hypothetical protein
MERCAVNLFPRHSSRQRRIWSCSCLFMTPTDSSHFFPFPTRNIYKNMPFNNGMHVPSQAVTGDVLPPKRNEAPFTASSGIRLPHPKLNQTESETPHPLGQNISQSSDGTPCRRHGGLEAHTPGRRWKYRTCTPRERALGPPPTASPKVYCLFPIWKPPLQHPISPRELSSCQGHRDPCSSRGRSERGGMG